MYIYVCIYMYIYVHKYIYIHTHLDSIVYAPSFRAGWAGGAAGGTRLVSLDGSPEPWEDVQPGEELFCI